MGMYINSSIASLGLAKSLYLTSVMQANTMKRLSSGIRINSASDDAAGLSLTEKLSSVISGNVVAKNNAQTGIAMLNTADSGLSVMMDSLDRIRNISIQSLNGTYSASERQMLQNEVKQLTSEVTRTYQSTTFNGKNVFGASPSSSTEVTQISESQATAAGYNSSHIIHSASEFVSKIAGHESENFILVNDIDMSQLGTLTDSAILNTFSGTLDGNGCTARNLTINNASGGGVGLFSAISGTVKNLSVASATINGNGQNWVGILATSVSATGVITNVKTSGTISSGGDETGGMVGQNDGNISNCSTSADVVGHDHIGGLVGKNTGTISHSYTAGSVSGNDLIGGLIGYQTGSGVISYGSSYANISGHGAAGGFIGQSDSGTITNSSASGNATVTTAQAGGFIAVNNGADISSSYSTGDVSAAFGDASGFVCCHFGGSITNCYATGSVDSGSGSGSGFSCCDMAPIKNSYTTSHVSGSDIYGFKINDMGSSDSGNFYKNNLSYDGGMATNADANVAPLPISGWDGSQWDLSGSLPMLKNVTRAWGESSVLFGLQIGDDASQNSKIDISTAFGLGVFDFDVSDKNSTNHTIAQVDQLSTFLATMRGNVGASVNKLSSVINIQDNRINNLTESRSNIQDADIASESAQMIKNQIRQQAGVSLLSQMNDLDKNLLMKLIG